MPKTPDRNLLTAIRREVLAAVREAVQDALRTGLPETSQDPGRPEFVRLRDALRLLAISRSTAYRLFRAGSLTPVKRGRSTLIARAEVDAYAARLRRPDDATSVGPFARSAGSLRALGLAVLPCGAGEKRPLVAGFTRWRGPPAASTVADWASKFPTANVGVVCGLSGLVVVDVDDPALVDTALAHFGATPLRVRTPSGGRHLYFRDTTGQRCRNLRLSHGAAIDVKGEGGFVLVPPSTSASGAPYAFEAGDFSVLAQLPPFYPITLRRPFPCA
jgi:excisionase family DNA binding protein